MDIQTVLHMPAIAANAGDQFLASMDKKVSEYDLHITFLLVFAHSTPAL